MEAMDDSSSQNPCVITISMDTSTGNTSEASTNIVAENLNFMTLYPNILPVNPNEPYLEIIEQPQDKFRYRYKSEMHGTHGCIMGVNKNMMQKTYPSVELKNFNGRAIIRCSLFSIDPNHRVPHPHLLVAKVGTSERPEPHDVSVPGVNGYRAVYQGIGIIHTARKYVVEALIDKKMQRKLTELGLGDKSQLPRSVLGQVRDEAALDGKVLTLNSVSLCYEAFQHINGRFVTICPPVYSTPINNMKSALTGDLRICRIDKVSGSCQGGDEIFIFVEKVNKKNIRIRFFEIDEFGNEVWEDYARFSELDVHHQYGIVFRTPPYRDTKITVQVEVAVQLWRPSDGLCSEPRKFFYKPALSDYGIVRKRQREDIPDFESTNVVYEQAQQVDLHVNVQQMEESAFLNADVELLPSVDNFTDFFPSHTTPSFEQFLVNNMAGTLKASTEALKKLPEEHQNTGRNTFLNENNLVTDNRVVTASSTNTGYMSKFGSETNAPYRKVHNVSQDFAPKMIEKIKKAEESVSTDFDFSKIIKNLVMSTEHTSVVHAAVRYNQLEALKELLYFMNIYMTNDDIQVIVNMSCDGQTPLSNCILFDQSEMVQILLDGGANPTLMDAHGTSPLEMCILEENVQCLEIILEHMKKHPELDVNYFNEDGLTVLHKAAIMGRVKMVSMLIAAGSDPTTKDRRAGSTPLHMALEGNHVEIVELLVHDKRVDVNARNMAQNTPLHVACVINGKGSVEMCKLLLKTGADPALENLVPASDSMEASNSPSSTGQGQSCTIIRKRRTPLDYANDPEVLSVLKSALTLREN